MTCNRLKLEIRGSIWSRRFLICQWFSLPKVVDGTIEAQETRKPLEHKNEIHKNIPIKNGELEKLEHVSLERLIEIGFSV